MKKSSASEVLNHPHPAFVGLLKGRLLTFVRRFGPSLLFILIAILTVADLIEDRIDGAPWEHLAVEGLIVLASVMGSAALWQRAVLELRSANEVLRGQLATAHADAERWRAEAATLLNGLGVAIGHQFDRWSLSPAERDVALLLLKGFSHKEIADLRETSERTVRQQAASIYAKGGLQGRYHLSAFFLEDLLIPRS